MQTVTKVWIWMMCSALTLTMNAQAQPPIDPAFEAKMVGDALNLTEQQRQALGEVYTEKSQAIADAQQQRWQSRQKQAQQYQEKWAALQAQHEQDYAQLQADQKVSVDAARKKAAEAAKQNEQVFQSRLSEVLTAEQLAQYETLFQSGASHASKPISEPSVAPSYFPPLPDQGSQSLNQPLPQPVMPPARPNGFPFHQAMPRPSMPPMPPASSAWSQPGGFVAPPRPMPMPPQAYPARPPMPPQGFSQPPMYHPPVYPNTPPSHMPRPMSEPAPGVMPSPSLGSVSPYGWQPYVAQWVMERPIRRESMPNMYFRG